MREMSKIEKCQKREMSKNFINIEKFHEAQKVVFKKIETEKGVECWQEKKAIEKVSKSEVIKGIDTRIIRSMQLQKPKYTAFFHKVKESLLGLIDLLHSEQEIAEMDKKNESKDQNFESDIRLSIISSLAESDDKKSFWLNQTNISTQEFIDYLNI